MPISLRKAILADIPTIGRISHYAFADHAWTRALYPTPDPEGNSARYGMRQEKAMKTDSKSTFFVAVDGSPTDSSAPVVGYSKWTIYDKPRPEAEWKAPYETIPVPEGGVQEASDVPGKALYDMRLRVYKGDPHVLLHFLVIDPNWQRRGIGGMLLKWGMDRSDELGVPAYLEGTREGYDLYYKNGFRTVDEMVVPTERWGLTEPIHLWCMKYTPGSREGKE